MIYYVQYGNKKPQRIADDHAHDFYQIWFGNNTGQTRFDAGDYCTCPDYPSLSMWGEEMKEAGWFKKILNGEVIDGMFDIEDLISRRSNI